MEQQIVTPDTSAPPDPDAAKYEALRKELNLEPEAVEPEPQPEVQPESEVQPEPVKISYEELEDRHRKASGALKEAKEQAQREKAEKQAILQIIEQARTQRQQPQPDKVEPPKVPDVTEDPIAHFKAEIAARDARIDALEKGTSQSTQQLQQWQQEQQLLSAIQYDDAQIRDLRNPDHKADYDDACLYLEKARIAQLDAMYPDDNPQVQQFAAQYGMTPPQYKAVLLNNDRRSVALHALQHGGSPAQLYYKLALGSGYQPKPNGKVVDVKANGKQQIEAVKRGRNASVSISGDSGGRKGAEDMSTADLAQLAIDDPDAFDRVWEQMAKAGKLG